MVETAGENRRLKVFVSFCGADIEFADKLIQGLKVDDRFEIVIDPDSTIDENDWKELIGGLIADADAVVFVLSPDAAETCEWEIEYAVEQSKRIVPIVCQPVDRNKTPDDLAGLKHIRFDGNRTFTKSLRLLTTSLSANSEWLREHTRLLVRAQTWDNTGRPSQLLLNDDEILAAKMWTLSRPDDAPKPTDLHISYIGMSEAVDTARASAVESVQADMDEMEALVHLQAQGSLLGRWVRQAYMVVGCWLAILALIADWQISNAHQQTANITNYIAQTCEQPPLHQQVALAIPVKRPQDRMCESAHASNSGENCAANDKRCLDMKPKRVSR